MVSRSSGCVRGENIMRRRAPQLFGALLASFFLLTIIWYHQLNPGYTIQEIPDALMAVDIGKSAPTKTGAPQMPDPGLWGRTPLPAVPSASASASELHTPWYANARGQVAWSEFRGRGNQRRIHAFIRTRGHTIDLGTLGGRNSVVEGLSACGHVIGWSHTPEGEMHAFLWS